MLAARSLSARRAWIEIMLFWLFRPVAGVALRKESVDRNACLKKIGRPLVASLSARRAWIEMSAIRRAVLAYYVALRKESVDRNRQRN